MKNTIGLIILILFLACTKEDTPEVTPPQPSPNPNAEVFVLSSQNMENISSYDRTSGKIQLFSPGNYGVGDILTNASITPEVPNGFLRKIITVSSDGKTLQTTSCPIEEASKEGSFYVGLTLLQKDKSSYKSEPGVKLFKPEKGYEFGFDFDKYVIYDQDGNTQTTDDQVILDGFLVFNYEIDVLLEVKNWKVKNFVFNNILEENSSLVVNSTLGTSNISEQSVVARYTFAPIILGTIGVIPVWVTPSFDVVLGTDGTVSVHTATVSNEFITEAGIKYENSTWGIISELNNEFDFEGPILSYNLDVTAFSGIDLNMLIYDVAGPSASSMAYLNLNAHNKTTYWTLNGGLKIDGKVKVRALSKNWVDQSKTLIEFEGELASGTFGGGVNPPIANFTANKTSVEVGEQIQFTDLSSNEITNWNWDFGDGSTSFFHNPIHAYSSPGEYTVSLYVSNQAGEDTETKVNYIHVESGGGNTIIIQPGPVEGKDAEIGVWFLPNGTESYYGVGGGETVECYVQENIGSAVFQEVLLQFPLGDIPPGATIVSAKLEVYGYGIINYVNQFATMRISKITSNWDENSVSWENKPLREYPPVESIVFLHEGMLNWYEADITEVVQEWVDEPSLNYGLNFHLAPNEASSEIHSSDNPDSSKRPKLIVKYQ